MSGKQELRVSDVAAELGVTSGRVYQLVAEGVIPATRRGRAIRVPRQAWEAWLARQTKDALANQRERDVANALA